MHLLLDRTQQDLRPSVEVHLRPHGPGERGQCRHDWAGAEAGGTPPHQDGHAPLEVLPRDQKQGLRTPVRVGESLRRPLLIILYFDCIELYLIGSNRSDIFVPLKEVLVTSLTSWKFPRALVCTNILSLVPSDLFWQHPTTACVENGFTTWTSILKTLNHWMFLQESFPEWVCTVFFWTG